MGDKIEELKQTMQHVEQLVLRFEIDMAAGLYVIDYHATIAQLCDEFGDRVRELQ
jgi:hypothetical protein